MEKFRLWEERGTPQWDKHDCIFLMHHLIHVSITKWNFDVTKNDTKQPENFFHLENTDAVYNAACDSQPGKRETRKTYKLQVLNSL